MGNLYLARTALADAGWQLVETDPHPDDRVPCTCGRRIHHVGRTQKSSLISALFRLSAKDIGASGYVCRECVFDLAGAIGTEEFDRLVRRARTTLVDEAVTP